MDFYRFLVDFGAHGWCHLACLVLLLYLPSWGTLGQSWDIREYKKGHFGDPFTDIFGYIWTENRFFHFYFQVIISSDDDDDFWV